MNRPLRGVDRTWAIVAAVFIGGAIVRLAFMLGYEPAFLGIPDSGSYITSAHQGLFSDLYHPAGYPLFVRVVHWIYPHVGLLSLVQHLLGLATAALWYATVCRITGGRLLGLIPAVVVLFDGFGIYVEHAPLSDPLFGFLVAAADLWGGARGERTLVGPVPGRRGDRRRRDSAVGGIRPRRADRGLARVRARRRLECAARAGGRDRRGGDRRRVRVRTRPGLRDRRDRAHRQLGQARLRTFRAVRRLLPVHPASRDAPTL